MKSRRTAIIVVALLLAVLAFVGMFSYLDSAQQRAYDNAELQEVFVVKKAIPKGLTGEQAIEQDYVSAGEIPAEFRPGSAINDTDDITNKVAINDLSPGQVVVDGQFVDANVAQVTFAQRVPAGQVAVSVSVDSVHGVAGLLLPGDKVNLMVTQKGDSPSVQTLFQNADILAIGSKAAPQAGESAATAANGEDAEAEDATDSGLITFSVPVDAAQRIALVQDSPELFNFYLALVPPENQPVPRPAEANPASLFNTGITPYPGQ